MRSIITNLTPASGRQDHTASPSADERSRQQRHPRPSHPSLTFVTIAKRPFVWAGMAGDIEVIWVKWEPEYFCKEDWTTQIRLNPRENFFSARHPRSKGNRGVSA